MTTPLCAPASATNHKPGDDRTTTATTPADSFSTYFLSVDSKLVATQDDKPATRKNRAPRPITEARKNAWQVQAPQRPQRS